MLKFSWNKRDKNRVPIMSAREMDELAEELVSDYKPELIKEPQPINYEHFLEFYLGVNLEYQDIRSDNPDEHILGMTAFGDDFALVYDNDAGRMKRIDVREGTVVLHSELLAEEKAGRQRKKLISPKQLKNPIILEPYDDSSSIQKNLAAAVVRVIGKILTEFGEKSSILLIGRYNYDMYKLFRTEVFEELPNNKVKCTEYPYANLTFMTAHSSKGLGYDNVILLNMTESKFGFPCQIEDDPIIKLVTYEDNSMPFAEERRLFYVALTRTKNRVYIAAPLNRPSRFLVELITDYNIPHPPGMNLSVVDLFSLRCPVCKFPLKYEFNKNYGLSLYICTNEPEVCDFMTNNRVVKKDIFKCNKCKDGYMIVKTNQKNSESFYGCTNFGQGKIGCKNAVSI